jgi:hypothetical protein
VDWQEHSLQLGWIKIIEFNYNNCGRILTNVSEATDLYNAFGDKIKQLTVMIKHGLLGKFRTGEFIEKFFKKAFQSFGIRRPVTDFEIKKFIVMKKVTTMGKEQIKVLNVRQQINILHPSPKNQLYSVGMVVKKAS